MFSMVTSGLNRFRRPRPPPFSDSDNPMTPSGEPVQGTTAPETIPGIFYPSLFDVFKVRYLFQWKITSEGLPAEIVELILDAAEYWPSVEARMDTKTIIRQDRDQVLLRTVPLCYDETTIGGASPKVLPHRAIHPCRMIVFSISSHDQGWGGIRGEYPYDGSFTWFDAEVIHAVPRSGSDATVAGSPTEPTGQGENPQVYGHGHPQLLPGPGKLQVNKGIVRETQTHNIVWHYLDNIQSESAEAEVIERSQGRGRETLDGRVVRALEVGDSIVIWGRARFPGWSNHVEQISVRVFWAV